MLGTQEFLSVGVGNGVIKVQSQFQHIKLNWFCVCFCLFLFPYLKSSDMICGRQAPDGFAGSGPSRAEVTQWGHCKTVVLMVLALFGNKLTAAFP